MPANTRAIGVVRVSQVGGREGDSFTSPDTQRERIAAWCDRDGLELVASVDELDVSGGTPLHERAGLRGAVEAVEAGDADVLVVSNFDRLVRSLRVQDEVVSRVEAAGGRVVALDFGEVTNDTAAQWLSGTMIGAVSEYYRRSIKERSGEAQQRAIARGIAPWPHIVPGYDRGPDRRLVTNGDADTMRRAFEMRADGARITDIREFLRAHGVDRNSHRVSWLLGSRIYLGEIHFGSCEPNRAAHEAIVDADTFARVQNVRVPQGRKAKSEQLLARLGVLRCGTCNARMVIGSQRRATKRYVFFRCPTEDCPRRVTIGAGIADSVVVEAVRVALADVEGRASIQQNARDAEAALERAERDLKNGIRNLAVLGDEPAVQAKLLELRAVRDDARAHVEQLGGQRAAVVLNGANDWDRLSLDARRALIRATVERAVVGTGGRGAERVSVELFGE